MATVSDRRTKPRNPRSSGAFRLSYEIRTGVSQVLSAELTDFHEEGCGFEIALDLPAGIPVLVEGNLTDNGGVEIRTKAFVTWSRPTEEDTFRVGVQFAEPLKLHRKANEALWREQNEDLYELLQISPNADSDTIHRVYRLLAQRYHPDNQETADPEVFRKVLEAYQVLSDPEKRAGYDSQYKTYRERRWRIFDQDLNGVMRFDPVLIAYQGNTDWVPAAITNAVACLQGAAIPSPTEDCDSCRYFLERGATLAAKRVPA